LINLAVLLSVDNTIVTAIKNTDAIAKIKRKPKRIAKRKSSMSLNEDSNTNQFFKNKRIAA
jgi:hypothetical protein